MHDWAEFRHFRYLLAILQQQGFRAAADVLHTAQPNLSIQARQFQENAEVRLFKKMPNGRIRPTEAGIAFTSLARFLLETRDEVIDALVAIERGSVGAARFGWTPFVDPDLFRAFCNLHKTLLPSSTMRPTHGDTLQLVGSRTCKEELVRASSACIIDVYAYNEIQIKIRNSLKLIENRTPSRTVVASRLGREESIQRSTCLCRMKRRRRRCVDS